MEHESELMKAMRNLTKDDLSPGARRIYDYLVGATDNFHEPAATTSSPISATRSTATSIRAATSTHVSVAAPLDSTPASVHSSSTVTAPTPATAAAAAPEKDLHFAPPNPCSTDLAPEAEAIYQLLMADQSVYEIQFAEYAERYRASSRRRNGDLPAHAPAPVAAQAAVGDLATTVPTSCSSECPSHDADVPLSVLISSAATTSSTTIGDVLSELAAPVVGYKALDIDASHISTVLRVPSEPDVVHDAVDNQAASMPTTCSVECPSRDASVSLAELTPLAAPTQSTTTSVDVSGLAEYTGKCSSVSHHRSNDIPTTPLFTTTAVTGLELRPLPWPSFECSQVWIQSWFVPIREKNSGFMSKLLGITSGDDTKSGDVEGWSDNYSICSASQCNS